MALADHAYTTSRFHNLSNAALGSLPMPARRTLRLLP